MLLQPPDDIPDLAIPLQPSSGGTTTSPNQGMDQNIGMEPSQAPYQPQRADQNIGMELPQSPYQPQRVDQNIGMEPAQARYQTPPPQGSLTPSDNSGPPNIEPPVNFTPPPQVQSPGKFSRNDPSSPNSLPPGGMEGNQTIFPPNPPYSETININEVPDILPVSGVHL